DRARRWVRRGHHRDGRRGGGGLRRRGHAVRHPGGRWRDVHGQAAQPGRGRPLQGRCAGDASVGPGRGLHPKERAMSSMTRRYLLKMGVLTAAASAATRAGGPGLARAQAKQLVVCSGGGAYQEAQRKTMFQPFEKETGIKIVEASPTDYGKLKA